MRISFSAALRSLPAGRCRAFFRSALRSAGSFFQTATWWRWRCFDERLHPLAVVTCPRRPHDLAHRRPALAHGQRPRRLQVRPELGRSCTSTASRSSWRCRRSRPTSPRRPERPRPRRRAGRSPRSAPLPAPRRSRASRTGMRLVMVDPFPTYAGSLPTPGMLRSPGVGRVRPVFGLCKDPAEEDVRREAARLAWSRAGTPRPGARGRGRAGDRGRDPPLPGGRRVRRTPRGGRYGGPRRDLPAAARSSCCSTSGSPVSTASRSAGRCATPATGRRSCSSPPATTRSTACSGSSSGPTTT